MAVAASWQGPACLWETFLCPASAFRAADLLFLAVPTEIQTSLFLFKYFSVVSPQPILLSWDQLGLDAIADLSSLCRQHENSSPYGTMQTVTRE